MRTWQYASVLSIVSMVATFASAQPKQGRAEISEKGSAERMARLAEAKRGADCFPATYDPLTKQATIQDTCGTTTPFLIRPSFATEPVWQQGTATNSTALEPTITFEDKPGGFDLLLEFDNQTGVTRSPGEIVIDGIRFGEDVRIEDFRITDLDDPDLAVGDDFGPFDDFEFGESIAGTALKTAYPINWFSPCFVLSDSTHTLGVSVQYPVLSYRHNLRFSVVSEAFADQFGRSWKIRIRLNAHSQGGSGGVQFTQEGELAPGEQRTYRVSVRVIEDDPAWTTTLMPYREYFQSTYGIVDYGHERDPRPVRAEHLARNYSIESCTGDLGYYDNEPKDPSPFYEEFMNPRTPGVGWTAWRDNLRDVTKELGYERVMVWSMSGRFTVDFPCFQNGAFNFPFIFASSLPLIGVDEPNPGDDYTMLNDIEAGGVEFGMYWGRAAQPMAPLVSLDDWNKPFDPGPPASGMVLTNATIDLSDPADLALAYGEFDTALTAGTTWVGMDAVTRLDLWDRLDYASDLMGRAVASGQTGFRITLEPFRGDVSAVMFAGLNTGNRLKFGPSDSAPTFMTMCDFLAPGHEVYAVTNGNPLPGDVPPEEVNGTVEYRLAQARRFARNGMIPLISNVNAIADGSPTNDGNVRPQPPIPITIPDPDNPKGPAITDPQYIAVRSWQANPALPDDPEIRRLGDVDLDGDCDADDLALLNTNMGRVPKYDLTGDGVVDASDIAIVMTYLGVY